MFFTYLSVSISSLVKLPAIETIFLVSLICFRNHHAGSMVPEFLILGTRPQLEKVITSHLVVGESRIYTECKFGGPLGRRPGRVMKVRLVRPRCFVLTMLLLKSLASWTG